MTTPYKKPPYQHQIQSFRSRRSLILALEELRWVLQKSLCQGEPAIRLTLTASVLGSFFHAWENNDALSGYFPYRPFGYVRILSAIHFLIRSTGPLVHSSHSLFSLLIPSLLATLEWRGILCSSFFFSFFAFLLMEVRFPSPVVIA